MTTTWPAAFAAPHTASDSATAPLARHAARVSGDVVGRPGDYGAAVDVWRDGAHIWRSYTPVPGATCDAWAETHYGPDYPTNHDEGYWGVRGVEGIADWPVPTLGDLAPVGGLAAVPDLIATLLALATPLGAPWPDAWPVPTRGALQHRLGASGGSAIVTARYGDAAVRALVARMPRGTVDSPDAVSRWSASLTRRAVRAGAMDAALPERQATFTAAPDCPPHILARRAKAALGVAGWPAQRVPGTMAWRLSRAPYRMTICQDLS